MKKEGDLPKPLTSFSFFRPLLFSLISLMITYIYTSKNHTRRKRFRKVAFFFIPPFLLGYHDWQLYRLHYCFGPNLVVLIHWEFEWFRTAWNFEAYYMTKYGPKHSCEPYNYTNHKNLIKRRKIKEGNLLKLISSFPLLFSLFSLISEKNLTRWKIKKEQRGFVGLHFFSFLLFY